MTRRLLVCAVVVFGAAVWSISGRDGGKAGELTVKDGDAARLTAPLSFRIERWGINLTGEMTTIEPSGHWRFVHFYLDADGKEQTREGRSGQLTAEQMSCLLKAMEAQDFPRWPARIGVEPKVNAHRYLIKLGKKETVLAGVSTRGSQKASERILQAARAPMKADSEAWKRFGAVAAEIEALTKPKAE